MSGASGKLILVRHGESEGNRDRIFTTTPLQLALTDLGRQQAREAGRRIKLLFDAEVVVASPFIRARQTAEIIAEVLGLPVEIEHDLHERHVGLLMGESYDSIMKQPDFDPERPWLWKPPEGESFEDVQARAVPVLDRLAAQHPGRDVVVVSHGGVMMSLWAHISGSWEGVHVPANCGIVLVEHDGFRYCAPRVVSE